MLFLQAFFTSLMPHLLEIFGVVITILIASLVQTLKARFGIEVEARHREALHSALLSGIRAALGRGLLGQAAVDDALRYVLDSVPDAITALNPNANVLTDLAAAKLREVMEKTPVIELTSDLPQHPLRR